MASYSSKPEASDFGGRGGEARPSCRHFDEAGNIAWITGGDISSPSSLLIGQMQSCQNGCQDKYKCSSSFQNLGLNSKFRLFYLPPSSSLQADSTCTKACMYDLEGRPREAEIGVALAPKATAGLLVAGQTDLPTALVAVAALPASGEPSSPQASSPLRPAAVQVKAGAALLAALAVAAALTLAVSCLSVKS